MPDKYNISNSRFSDLENVLKELTRLQQENISLQLEIEYTKQKVLEARQLAQIESKVYSGIKKLFK